MDILLVHVPASVGKKSHDTAFSFSKSINYGLLSIGTYLKGKGHDVKILDHRDKSNDEYISEIKKSIYTCNPLAVGLFCISGFSYPNLIEYSNSIKKIFPDIPIIAGGKDHVGLIAESLLEECSSIDIVVLGEGEEVTNLILNSIKSGRPYNEIPNIFYRESKLHRKSICNHKIAFADLPLLDYTLYPNGKSFPPSIEISRGCPFKCNFCVSARTKVRKKSISEIIQEIILLSSFYGDRNIKIYFETPIMLFTSKEIDELVNFRKKSGIDFRWRTETRVEYLQSHSIERLAEAGLKVIDMGLESGSPQILLRMNKANNPATYLTSAIKVLKKANSQNILIKINILFYVGENKDTISETLAFLEANQDYIKSVSAYPLIGFPCETFGVEFLNELSHFGGSIVRDSEWASRKLFPINPSSELSYKDLQKVSKLICKSYQSIDDFFMQKQYGYFSPNISFDDFLNAAEKHGFCDMPFYASNEERIRSKESLKKLLFL